MSKTKSNRKYERMELEGREYLVLLNDVFFSKLETKHIETREDMARTLSMVQRCAEIGAEWFTIETGRTLTLRKHQDGFTWLIESTRPNSMNYQWLSGKAKKYEHAIARHVNRYNEKLKKALPKEESDDGSEEG